MAITLDTVQLPDDLEWIDEYDWSPVSQVREHTIGGSLVVEEGTMLAGRPITLSGRDYAWVERSVVDELRALLVAGQIMTLTLEDGRQFAVIWRHDDRPIQAAPVDFRAPPEATDPYYIELRLIEV